MKVKRKQVGVIIYLDKEGNIVGSEPKYKGVLVESKWKRLFSYDRFYISLILPILFTILVFISVDTRFVPILYFLLGLSLSLTIKSIVEVFSE